MKRWVARLALAGTILGFAAVAQAVPTLVVGDIAFKFTDSTFFDLAPGTVPGVEAPAYLPNGDPNPAYTGSDRTWGIAAVTGVYELQPGASLENPIVKPTPIWSASPGDYLLVRFGGTDLAHVVGNTYYFAADADPDYTKNGNAYVEIYHSTAAVDYFSSDYMTGPYDPASGKAPGEYDSFGLEIAYGPDKTPGTADDPTLYLDIAMQTGILPAYDTFAQNTDVEAFTVWQLLTGAATIYGDIVGGAAMSYFEEGVFPLNSSAWGTALDPDPAHNRADLKFKANLTAQYDATTGTWYNPYGWTNESQDPVTARVVPEPGTMILLGSGLLGVAGWSRRRKKSA